ncbi:MAG: nickel pincer cofactor biosynthesis protein LarC [Methanohalobium sp.]|uniref:nickel pincer cofactor biosynthesis protein LarC n=1 Tax=Methanohalobium sp. TaxID=2837493 RepID=UPI00397E56C8
MQALVFEPFSGASGDMVIASLIGLGADQSRVKDIMESVADVSVSINQVKKNGIHSINVDVESNQDEKPRKYYDIIDTIKSSSLSNNIEKDVLDIFSIMSEAESRIHNQNLLDLHFHEIGQMDAIADVVGACTAVHEFNFDKIYCTPIITGKGLVESEHGKLPVPAPATMEILKTGNMIFQNGNILKELLTPTGAAILSHFAVSVDNYPPSQIKQIGYGAGDLYLDEQPNVLRTSLSEIDNALVHDSVEVLETNVDDITGQVLGYLVDELLAMGARDVTITPTTMKKGRPGHIIHVVSRPSDTSKLARKIITETGSLGVRVIPTRHRLIAKRCIEKFKIKINDEYHEVNIKIARDVNGTLLNISAEYEDCKKIADFTGLILKDIIRTAEETAKDILKNR